MANTSPRRIKTISEYHQFKGLSKPLHPLISVIDYAAIKNSPNNTADTLMLDFYSIAIKRLNGEIRYGQQEYDFDNGIMFFISPGQVFKVSAGGEAFNHFGWMLLIHPDFLWNTPLANMMRQYEYFDYSVNEALFLSEREEATVAGILQHIEQEYQSNIDKFSQNIIIAQLELLFSYAERFYNRQFITRKISNHQILDRLEALLNSYFDDHTSTGKGLPTVSYIAQELNISPGYLGSVLRMTTGQNTQQLIHNKLIDKAKEKLSTTQLSVSEIAYELGFEHPQSFSKLFKTKTGESPVGFRRKFGNE